MSGRFRGGWKSQNDGVFTRTRSGSEEPEGPVTQLSGRTPLIPKANKLVATKILTG